MRTLIAILNLLGMPFKVFFVIVKYFTVGTLHRKLQGSLIKNIKMAVCKAGLALKTKNSALIAIPNSLVLKIVSLKHKSITSNLPNYGESFDKNTYWIVKKPNREQSDPIIIYSHGGGYFLQTQPSQIESIISIYKLLNEDIRDKVSILLLDYGLVSKGKKLPSQIDQLHETYLKLIDEGNTNIILMGDSAGGHLTINYLHFLNYSSPNIIYPSNIILISPWINLKFNKENISPGKSFYDNCKYDMVTYPVFEEFDLNDFIPSYDVFTDPKYAFDDAMNKNKWNNIPFFKDSNTGVFVIVGEDESLRDEVLEWCEVALDAPVFKGKKYGDSNNQLLNKLRFSRQNDSNCKVELYIEPWGVHDSIFFFENPIISKVKSKKYKSQKDIDSLEFYGISRVVEFINKNI